MKKKIVYFNENFIWTDLIILILFRTECKPMHKIYNNVLSNLTQIPKKLFSLTSSKIIFSHDYHIFHKIYIFVNIFSKFTKFTQQWNVRDFIYDSMRILSVFTYIYLLSIVCFLFNIIYILLSVYCQIFFLYRIYIIL